MAHNSESDINMKGAPACRRCYMLVARFAPQIDAGPAVYHRECYEAWYFAQHRRRPRLLAGTAGDRHRYRLVEDGERAIESRAA
jgi:hypothetical protein